MLFKGIVTLGFSDFVLFSSSTPFTSLCFFYYLQNWALMIEFFKLKNVSSAFIKRGKFDSLLLDFVGS
jgi:hypothetical protein